MTHLRIYTSLLKSKEYAEASCEDRGMWISLLLYCAEQENGGVILGCRAWACVPWMLNVGVAKWDVRKNSSLWEWRGNDLHVWGFPVESECKSKD